MNLKPFRPDTALRKYRLNVFGCQKANLNSQPFKTVLSYLKLALHLRFMNQSDILRKGYPSK